MCRCSSINNWYHSLFFSIDNKNELFHEQFDLDTRNQRIDIVGQIEI